MTISKTPLRISFAGGGTDLPEFYTRHGYGAVLSTAIDKYIRVSVSKRYDGKVLVYAGGTCELVDRASDLKHNIIRECLRFAGINDSIEVHVQADLPGSSGLGSSSALTVGLLVALNGNAMGDVPAIAFQIERHVCGNPVGKQDHYIAASGGMYHFTFKDSGRVECEPFGATCLEWLNTHLMLFDTGTRRSASEVLSDVTGRQNDDLLINMRAQASDAMKIIQRRGDLGLVLHKGWDLKKATSEMVTTPEIDQLYAKALDAGATGGKICGAGGGGFLLLWVPEDRRGAVGTALGLPYTKVKVGVDGSRIVYEDP